MECLLPQRVKVQDAGDHPDDADTEADRRGGHEGHDQKAREARTGDTLAIGVIRLIGHLENFLQANLVWQDAFAALAREDRIRQGRDQQDAHRKHADYDERLQPVNHVLVLGDPRWKRR